MAIAEPTFRFAPFVLASRWLWRSAGALIEEIRKTVLLAMQRLQALFELGRDL